MLGRRRRAEVSIPTSPEPAKILDLGGCRHSRRMLCAGRVSENPLRPSSEGTSDTPFIGHVSPVVVHDIP